MNLTHILVSNKNRMFTYLNRFNPKKSEFEGEYSIVHNRHSNDSYFVSRFLIANKGLPITLLTDEDQHYHTIVNHYERFLYGDIEKYVDEKMEKEKDQQNYLEANKKIGQLQISIIKKLVEEKLKEVRLNPGSAPEEMRIALGKELMLEWMLSNIDDIIKKGNM